MDRKKYNLLKINEFAKLVGVSTHALRRYDAMGILKPAYVDPDSGYRYYSFYQMELVIPIQFCVHAEVPLAKLRDINFSANAQVHYNELMSLCISNLGKKIQLYKTMLNARNAFLPVMARADQIAASEAPGFYQVEELDCFAVPHVAGNSSASQMQMMELITEIHNQGLEIGWNTGLFLRLENGVWRKYLFASFCGNVDHLKQHPLYVHLPGGEYLCYKAHARGIEQAWSWSAPYANASQIQLIVEAELCTSNFDYIQPMYEQRCLIQTNRSSGKNTLSSKSS